MKLQRREKILAGLALGLVALAGLWFLFFAGDPRSDDQLIRLQDELTSKIATERSALDKARRDAKHLADWQRRSLPPDPVSASSLYQNWLRDLAKHVNLQGYKLVANEVVHRDQSTRVSFTLHAQAHLGELVQFLYEFYAAGYLHQIRNMDVKPSRNSSTLDLVLTIEAASLPKAESKKELPKLKESARVLQLKKDGVAATLADYRDPIVKRNFFANYVKPPEIVINRRPPKPERPPPPRVDLADHAVVTGFTEVDGTPQVWLKDRITDKSWILGTGEGFTVGDVKGTVQTIDPEGEAIVDFGGHRRLLHKGDNLRLKEGVVTGITPDVHGNWQVWIEDRGGGKSWQLGVGEGFTVGKVRGTVQTIHPEEVVVEFGGNRRVLHKGDNLNGGVESHVEQLKLPAGTLSASSGPPRQGGSQSEQPKPPASAVSASSGPPSREAGSPVAPPKQPAEDSESPESDDGEDN